MATIKTNTNNTYYAVLTLTEGSYNIEANTSPVRYSLTLYNGIQNFSGYTIGYEIIINGVQVAYQNNSGNQTSMAANSSKTVATGSTTITHDADGSKTISASVRIWTNNTSYLPVSLSGSGNMALATIPRASTPTLSASSFNAGSALTITTNRASSSFTHTLKYTLNGTTGTIATGVGASYTWTAANTKALAGLIPNATSGTVKITCETYNGTTHIGTKTVNGTVKVPETADYMPTVSSVAVTDAIGYAEKYSGYVQGKSAPTVTITAASTYSTIKSYKVEFQGTTLSGSSNVVSLATVNSIGLLDVVVTVTDGRGRTATKTAQITALAYNSPILSLKVIRCNADGTENNEGAYMLVTCNAEITDLNEKNSNTITLKYKKKTTDTWTTKRTWYVYKMTAEQQISADADSSYDIQLVAVDDFTTATFTAELGTAEVILDFNESGKGLGIGKVSEGDGLEVAWDSTFGGTVTAGIEIDITEEEAAEVNTSLGISGVKRLATLIKSMAYKLGLIADYIVETGEDGIYSWEKYNSGKMILIIKWSGNVTYSISNPAVPSHYRPEINLSFTYPVTFIKKPAVISLFSSATSGGGACSSYYVGLTDKAVGVWPNLYYVATVLTNVYMIIEGKWK